MTANITVQGAGEFIEGNCRSVSERNPEGLFRYGDGNSGGPGPSVPRATYENRFQLRPHPIGRIGAGPKVVVSK